MHVCCVIQMELKHMLALRCTYGFYVNEIFFCQYVRHLERGGTLYIIYIPQRPQNCKRIFIYLLTYMFLLEKHSILGNL